MEKQETAISKERVGSELVIEDLKALKPLVEKLDEHTVLSISLEGQVSSDGQET